MKLEHIVALAVRLFALMLAFFSITNIAKLLPLVHKDGWETISPYYFAIMASFILVAIFLWNFPMTVSKGLVKFKGPAENDVEKANIEQIEIVAVTILGLYLLYFVISDMVYWGIVIFVSATSRIPIEISVDQKGQIIATIIETIFVLFLLLGSKRVVALLHRMRYGNEE